MAHRFIDCSSALSVLAHARVIIWRVTDSGLVIVLHVLWVPHLGLRRAARHHRLRLVVILLLLIPVREVVVLVGGGLLARWWQVAGGEVARGAEDLLERCEDGAVLHLPC